MMVLPNKMQVEHSLGKLGVPIYGQRKEREYIVNSVERTLEDLLLESLQCIIKNVSIGSVKSTCLITLIRGSKGIMLKCCKA